MRLHLLYGLLKSFLHQFLLLRLLLLLFAIFSSSPSIAIFLVILWSTRHTLSLLIMKVSSYELLKSFDSYVIIKQCPTFLLLASFLLRFSFISFHTRPSGGLDLTCWNWC